MESFKAIRKILSLASALLLTAMLPGCSGNLQDIDSALDAVPDNVRYIAVIDAERLGNNAEIFFPTDMILPLKGIVGAGTEAVDLSQITIFTLPKGYTAVAVKVKNRELLEETLEKQCRPDKALDDLDIFDCGKRKIAVGENICFIAPDVKTIKTILKADHPEISAIEGIRQFLSTNEKGVKSAAIASDTYGKKLEGLWLCCDLRLPASSINLDITLMQPDGESGHIGELLADEIDPTVLTFIPGGCSIVAATGKQQEGAKMFGIEALMRSAVPVELNLSETGTTAWYGRPAGRLSAVDPFDPKGWNFISISQASPQEGEQIVDSYLDQFGRNARKDPETNCYTVMYNDRSATFGYLDGFTIMGINGDVTTGNSNPYTQDFQGARMVVIVDVPKGSPFYHALDLCPYGMSLNIKATTDVLTAKFRFYGLDGSAVGVFNRLKFSYNLLPHLMGLR